MLRLGNNRKLGRHGFDALAASAYLDRAVVDLGGLGDKASLAALRERFGDVVVTRAPSRSDSREPWRWRTRCRS